MRFDGKRILITGASRGIGRALALQLAAEGAEVLALARGSKALDDLPEGIERLACDLTDSRARTALIAGLQGQRLDGVINNAGIQITADFANGTADAQDIEQELAVNLTAPMHLAAGLLPVLACSPGSFLVNVTSGLALAPKRQAPVYCASKAGLRSFTRALRYQAEDAGLRVRIIDCVMVLAATQMTAGRGRGKISPNAAAALLDGAAAGKSEIWVGQMKLLRLIHRLSPALAARILRG
ncbi:SDR family NAD(P)-dependent oxidoreductase [Leisingera aquaemixtae]|uniref:SDR family NAD(P)-dependent oxidoreductase n=1 Tax=Leisingera aquaemixtae TaxID=1396826 RepID=UPI001C96D976|nr:SDR family NAD(P)-dependent oxidoreductase [Leisingera aquaemixtae]MBY6068751.1 SDR family NAD(P)-dependent oxidoreductase [Leisingera aquaemixtae]